VPAKIKEKKMECPECGAEVERETFFCTECGVLFEEKTAVLIADAAPRQVLNNRYVILSPLGRGGMGAVYLAKDTQLEKVVAVKTLPAEIACDLRAIDWMKEEVRIAQDLRHDNIAAIYNFETDPEKQSSFIVMELIVGVDLHTLLARSPEERLPLDIVGRILKQCSEALAYAHSKRIIHRDIKPKNIMITKDGTVKVTDLGIARRLRETMSKISQTVIAGTPAYMAPEHLMGKNIDARADIYSLGATIYELITGTPPFHKGQIDIQIMQKDVPPLDASLFDGDTDLAGRLTSVLRKCMSKEPAARYSTTTEFYEAFRQAAGIDESSEQILELLSAAVGAALVDQREMLTRTLTPQIQSPTPALTPISALPPTELTPAIPARVQRKSRMPFFYAVLAAAVIIVVALSLIPVFSPREEKPDNEGNGDSSITAQPASPAVEGPPKLAFAEFIYEGDAGTNTPMSLANIVMYRAKKKIEGKYKIVEPLELKGILESLGMKVAQLTDYESAKRLFTERGIRYLILCTVVKGAYTELEGRMIDLKEGKIIQQDKPYLRWASDISYGTERLGDILTLDDGHKKIYDLLRDARSARSDGKYEEMMAHINEALKIDKQDPSIQQAMTEQTEAIVKKALDRCKYRKYAEAMQFLEHARKYNFSPEPVKELPEKLLSLMLSEGEKSFANKKYDQAIEAYEWSLKLKDDESVKTKLKEVLNAKKERDGTNSNGK
jgi:serine/threonine protein kinase